MNPPPLLAPLPPPTPEWQRALGGIWRLTFPRYLAPANLGIFAGLLGGLALLALSGVGSGHGDQFSEWSVHFYLTLVVPVVAFLSAAGLIREDMKSATTDYVLTRPVRRHAFALYRFLSHTACVQAQCLLALAVLAAVGAVRQVPGLASIAPSLLLAQVLTITAFGALGFAFGAFTRHYLILGIAYAVIVELGIGQIPTPLSRLSLLHHVRTIASQAINLGSDVGPKADNLPVAIIALVLLSLVLAGIAAVRFSLLESAGTKPKES